MNRLSIDFRRTGESAFSVVRHFAAMNRLPTNLLLEPSVRSELEQGRSPIRPGRAERLAERWAVEVLKPTDTNQPLSRMWAHTENGILVPRHAVETATAKVCPECIRERGYWRANWDFAYSLVCPTHGAWLVGTCPNCRRRLTYLDGSAVQCGCGFDLRTITPVVCDADSHALGTLLTQKLTGEPEKLGAPRHERALLTQSYSDVIKLVDFVQYHLGSENRQAFHHLSGIADLDVRRAKFAFAAACLLGEEKILNAQLDSLFQVSSGRSLDLLANGRRFYEGLLHSRNAHALQPLRERFVRWIAQLRFESPTRRGSPVVVRDGTCWTVVTLRDAVQLTGLSRQRVRRAIERGHIRASVQGVGPSRVYRIERTSLLEFSQLPRPWRTDGQFPLAELAKRLGISVPAAKHLRDRGAFDDYEVWEVDTAGALLADIRKCLPRRPSDDRDVVPFRVALTGTWRKQGLVVADVVLAILGGMIAPLDEDASAIGLNRFLFRRKDVRSLRTALKRLLAGSTALPPLPTCETSKGNGIQ